MAKPKDKLKAKAAEKKSPLTGKKITMKMTFGTPKRAFVAGDSYVVGKDLSAETAQAWLDSGAAEFTSEKAGPSEIK